jgi:phenylacetate-coenzyme A ligase PaaK-like adenylate-forming protein
MSMGKTSSPYWNAFIETLARDELVKIQVRKFREVLNHAIKMSPMYREKFLDVGLTPKMSRAWKISGKYHVRKNLN